MFLIAKAWYEQPSVIFIAGLVLLSLLFWYFATEKEKTKRNVGTALTLLLCSLCVIAIVPPQEKLKGGIDILGGSSFLLRVQHKVDDEGNKVPLTVEQIEQAIKVIEGRLNASGTAESVIARQGDNMIVVQMPGVEPEEAKRIRTILEKTSKLELREVSPRNMESGSDGKTLAQRVAEGLEIVPGYNVFYMKPQDSNSPKEPILLSRRIGVTGKDIVRAIASEQARDAVSVTLSSSGADKMIALTGDKRAGQDRIAIVLDGEVLSAPVLNQTPLGGQFEITGLNDPGEPKELAQSLMNPLENALIVEQESSVSASLGKAIIDQGVYSGIIGLLIVFVVVILYYRTAGIIALVGLLVNGLVLFGIMGLFGFTFTLPGIAGIILIIGMAVDSNVLIYERLREELAAGKTLVRAISISYEKAFSAIFDANLTSLITALTLFWFASGTVKGFAVTLAIGIAASLFSSVLVTRVLFYWGIDSGLLRKLSFMNLIRAEKFDFLGKRTWAAILSITLMAASFITVGMRQESSLGVDFTGGTLLQYQIGKDQHVSMSEAKKVIDQLTLTKAAFPQEESNPTTGELLSVRCDTRDADKIDAALRQAIPLLGEKEANGNAYKIQNNREEVSALVGFTFMKESLMALGLGVFLIFFYIAIRFEFSFAFGAIVAMLHDVIISIGVIVMFGGELSLIHVGAILTIAGYSINDTIVVFDRVRENFLAGKEGSTEQIMNEALNATLSRTLLTSSTTIISVLTLALFGGTALKDFSNMILIGLFVGTYSSVFVAAPVVYWFSRRKGGNLRHSVVKPIPTRAA